jgi:hypothetical protein
MGDPIAQSRKGRRKYILRTAPDLLQEVTKALFWSFDVNEKKQAI